MEFKLDGVYLRVRWGGGSGGCRSGRRVLRESLTVVVEGSRLRLWAHQVEDKGEERGVGVVCVIAREWECMCVCVRVSEGTAPTGVVRLLGVFG